MHTEMFALRIHNFNFSYLRHSLGHLGLHPGQDGHHSDGLAEDSGHDDLADDDRLSGGGGGLSPEADGQPHVQAEALPPQADGHPHGTLQEVVR